MNEFDILVHVCSSAKMKYRHYMDPREIPFTPGDIITWRSTLTEDWGRCLYLGFKYNDDTNELCLHFMGTTISSRILFESFEYFDKNQNGWRKFGTSYSVK